MTGFSKFIQDRVGVIDECSELSKPEITFLTLNKEDSLKFYENKKFRIEVISSIGPSKQLCLDLSGCTKVINVSVLGGVHTLNLSGCIHVSDVSALRGVHNLNLSRCVNVSDVSALGDVHTLNLCGCVNVSSWGRP